MNGNMNGVIEITHNFNNSDRAYNRVPIRKVEEYLKMNRNCYERTSALNRVYIDIDGKADINMSEAEFIEKDAAIEKVLLNIDFGTPISLMKASKYKGLKITYEDIKKTKVLKIKDIKTLNILSYRITFLKKYGSKPAIKHYVETVANPIIKNALKGIIEYAITKKEINSFVKNKIETYVDYDEGVYSLPSSKDTCGRKMRMWNSIKHIEKDYRPNVLCGNATVLDTLITYIPEDCELIPDPQLEEPKNVIVTKKTKKSNESKSVCPDPQLDCIESVTNTIKKSNETNTICSDPRLDCSASIITKNHNEYEWNDVMELVSMLSEERATGYTSWRDTIFCLRNIEKSPRMLELCHSFAKKSYKYNDNGEDSTNALYNSENEHDNPLTIKSLYYWAKQDSPSKYNTFICNQKCRDKKIDDTLTDGYISLANLYYEMHGDKILIMYDSDRVSKNTYYFFNDKTGLWDTIVKETLCSDISEKLSILVKHVIQQHIEKSCNLDRNKNDENVKKEKERIEEKIKELRKLHFTIQDIKKVFSVASHVIARKQKEQYEAQKMNVNPGYLSVKNGMIDLKTGELIKRAPEHYQTFYIDIEYDVDADTSLMDQFINNMFKESDKEVKKLLCNLIGYSITGVANKKIFPLIIGDGDNGKSELINIIKETIGKKYLGTVEYEELSASNTNTNLDTLYNARNARMLIIVETKKNAVFNENKIKKITGRDAQHVSAKYKNAEEMTTECIPWIVSNFKPDFSGDKTIWNRIISIPLNVQFIDRNDARWDEDAFEEGDMQPKDGDFIRRLYNNKEGILRWIVKQSENYTKEGLQIPEAIKLHKEAYNKACTERAMLPIKQFIERKWVISEKGSVTTSDIFEEYIEAFPLDRLLSIKQFEAKIIPVLKLMNVEKYRKDNTVNGIREQTSCWRLDKNPLTPSEVPHTFL
jgi:P4 family phage/plasmid primase-like protien